MAEKLCIFNVNFILFHTLLPRICGSGEPHIMNEDIVCLLQDLGKEVSVDVIANFIIKNPEVEDLIAAKMGSLLSAPEAASHPNVPSGTEPPSYLARATSLLPESVSQAIVGLCSYKMILVVNMELGMGRGKQCAQVAHAALGLYLKIQQSGNDEEQLKLYQWISMGQKKIVVKGNDLNQIRQIQQQANEARLYTHLVSDAGCTQIPPGSKTVLAIFGANEEIDKVTGSLKLL